MDYGEMQESREKWGLNGTGPIMNVICESMDFSLLVSESHFNFKGVETIYEITRDYRHSSSF